MQQVKIGDLLTAKTGIIVHGCNAQGVMGSGVARQIKERWPECYKAYWEYLRVNGDCLGDVVPCAVSADLVIANAITQLNYGKNGEKYVSYKAVQSAFNAVRDLSVELNYAPVHYPMIGAGLGGGEWSIISAIIDDCFSKVPGIERILWVYE